MSKKNKLLLPNFKQFCNAQWFQSHPDITAILEGLIKNICLRTCKLNYQAREKLFSRCNWWHFLNYRNDLVLISFLQYESLPAVWIVKKVEDFSLPLLQNRWGIASWVTSNSSSSLAYLPIKCEYELGSLFVWIATVKQASPCVSQENIYIYLIKRSHLSLPNPFHS